jgi:hypothetical protein
MKNTALFALTSALGCLAVGFSAPDVPSAVQLLIGGYVSLGLLALLCRDYGRLAVRTYDAAIIPARGPLKPSRVDAPANDWAFRTVSA